MPSSPSGSLVLPFPHFPYSMSYSSHFQIEVVRPCNSGLFTPDVLLIFQCHLIGECTSYATLLHTSHQNDWLSFVDAFELNPLHGPVAYHVLKPLSSAGWRWISQQHGPSSPNAHAHIPALQNNLGFLLRLLPQVSMANDEGVSNDEVCVVSNESMFENTDLCSRYLKQVPRLIQRLTLKSRLDYRPTSNESMSESVEQKVIS
ncbi:hypothetical protein V8B97DRAFT_972484 [Scleroderma yunnanense]